MHSYTAAPKTYGHDAKYIHRNRVILNNSPQNPGIAQMEGD